MFKETEDVKDSRMIKSNVSDLPVDRSQFFTDNLYVENPFSRLVQRARDKRADRDNPKLSLDEIREQYPEHNKLLERFNGPISSEYFQRVVERDKEKKQREYNYQRLEKEDAYMDYTFGEGRLKLAADLVSEFDPVNIGLDLALMGVANRGLRLMQAAKKAGKYSKAFKMAKFTGKELTKKQGAMLGVMEGIGGNLVADGMAFGVIDLKDDYDYTTEQFLLSVGAGAAFGGLIGAFTNKTRLDDLSIKKAKDGKVDTDYNSKINDTEELLEQTPDDIVEGVSIDDLFDESEIDEIIEVNSKGEVESTPDIDNTDVGYIKPDRKPVVEDIIETKKRDLDEIKVQYDDTAKQLDDRIAEIDEDGTLSKLDTEELESKVDDTDFKITEEEKSEIKEIVNKKKELEQVKKQLEEDIQSPYKETVDSIEDDINKLTTEKESIEPDSTRADEIEYEISQKVKERQEVLNKYQSDNKKEGFKNLISTLIRRKNKGISDVSWRHRITNAVFPYANKTRKFIAGWEGSDPTIRYSVDGEAVIVPMEVKTYASSKSSTGYRQRIEYELQYPNGRPYFGSDGKIIRGGQRELGARYFDEFSKFKGREAMKKTIALESNYIEYEIDGVRDLAESISNAQKAKGIDTDPDSIKKSLVAKYVRDVNKKELDYLDSQKTLSSRKELRRDILRERLDNYDTSKADDIIEAIDGTEIDKRISRLYHNYISKTYEPLTLESAIEKATKGMTEADKAEVMKKLDKHNKELKKAIDDYDVCTLTGSLPDE